MNEIYLNGIKYYFAHEYYFSWQALMEYLQIDLSLKIKQCIKCTFIHSLHKTLYVCKVDSVK